MTPDTIRLILIRHGEVDSNREFRYLGRTDEPLNPTGTAQASAIATTLADLQLDLVVSSPLSRAQSTAQRVLEGRNIPSISDDRLVELDFGDWEGLSRAQIVAHSPNHRQQVERWEANPTIPPPAGESLSQLQARVVDLSDQMAREHPGRTAALVSHMGPIKALLCAALDLPLTHARRIFLDPGTISVVDWGPAPVVRLVNSHGHLGFASARWNTSP